MRVRQPELGKILLSSLTTLQLLYFHIYQLTNQKLQLWAPITLLRRKDRAEDMGQGKTVDWRLHPTPKMGCPEGDYHLLPRSEDNNSSLKYKEPKTPERRMMISREESMIKDRQEMAYEIEKSLKEMEVAGLIDETKAFKLQEESKVYQDSLSQHRGNLSILQRG